MKKNTGFSLIEILICSLIIGIAGITLAKLQTVFILNSSIAEQRIEASAFAQSRLDQIRRFIDTHNKLVSSETIDNGIAIDLIGEKTLNGKSAQFKNTICIKKTSSEACRTSATDLTLAEKDILMVQSTTTWTDASNTPQATVLFSKLIKSTAPWPNPICQWTASNAVGYQKGMYALHTMSSNKKNVWLCNKTGGCGVAEPAAGSGWVDVGQFMPNPTPGIHIDTSSACTPPNPDGSPKTSGSGAGPTTAPTAAPAPTATPSGGGAIPWAEGVTYTAGQKVTYNGGTYECIQAHTAWVGTNWNPAATPTMWKKL
ncbi:carbohydrate-binding protein [Chitinibacter sp. FCG-7]|uniref:Carbohydrate-binding protein n=1 Tax=Chitinibacter mangrovi TaxID=3153927 RepID=A0AAU7F8T0_9NEIS